MNPVAIIIALAIGWVLQLGLSLWQIRRFHSRVAELRSDGTASVGLAGGTYRGRVYTVLVADKDNNIVHAEKLSGWTVLANLKPVPALVGLPASVFLDEDKELPVSKKIRESFTIAAKELLGITENEEGEDE
ncbi:MAG: hypothetical protein DWQ07_07380 [Chloroflexi bacterium]|nr:MAG: hypothetical protein DWQ07_07380 [Chloroflexota bacterium]MBL1195477.1 hypothetical protein [Chloroflexota bacterium]NOH12759.1 hypothetical protein [Chloroflexota bacterium]